MKKVQRLIALNLTLIMLMLAIPLVASADISGIQQQPTFEREEKFTISEAGDYIFLVTGGFQEPNGIELPTFDSAIVKVYDSSGALYTPTGIERISRNSLAFRFTLAPGEYRLVQELNYSAAVSSTSGFLALYCWPADAPLTAYPVNVDKSVSEVEAYAMPPMATQGTVVALNTHPVWGSGSNCVFDKWIVSGVDLGADETNPMATFVMPAKDVSATAIFTTQRIVEVTVAHEEWGWVGWRDISRNSWYSLARPGDIIRLDYEAKPGYEFKRWEVISGGVTLDRDELENQWQFILPDSPEPVQIEAYFMPLSGNYVTVNVINEYEWGNASPPIAKAGTPVYLSAESNRFSKNENRWYTFTGWEVMSGNVILQDDGESVYFIMPDEPVELEAVYSPSHIVTVTSNNYDWGSVSCRESIDWDPQLQRYSFCVSLWQSAYPGYEFVDWEVIPGGVDVEINEWGYVYCLQPDNDVEIRANFKPSRIRDVIFMEGGVRKSVGDANFTNIATVSDGTGEITYSSSNTSVAIVHSTTGEVTIIGPGVTTITAVVAQASDGWVAASGSYTLIVTGVPEVPTVPTVPTVPGSFSASAGNAQVMLSWSAPESNGGKIITGYQVSSDDGVTWVAASNDTSHTFTGLTNGTLYTFRVCAVNEVGSGAAAIATATPQSPPPGDAKNVPVTSIKDESPPLVDVVPIITPEQVNPFDDVADVDWFFDDVMYVYNKSLMMGTASGKFSPGIRLNRAMIVTILYRYEKEPSVTDLENPFSDVPAMTWYTDAVTWAANNLIVTGFGGKFNPLDNITRQDLALILMRYAEYKHAELPLSREYYTFNDDALISDYAKAAVIQSYRAGIINGRNGNYFDPLSTATRAESAAMLHRFLMLLQTL